MDLRSFAGAIARYPGRRHANWIIPGTAHYDWTSAEFTGTVSTEQIAEVMRTFVVDLAYAETGSGRSLQHGYRRPTTPYRVRTKVYTWRSCDH